MKAVNEEAGWQLSNPLFFLTKEIELMCKAAEERAKGGRKEFDRAGVKKGLQIWRIEMARAKPWDYRKYGKFHRGDSYIVLNCYPGENGVKLMYDVHFWIGAESSEDEYGTAAFKTAGLDTVLWKSGKRGNTHREVMEFESELFLSYFKEMGGLEYLEGGIDGLNDKPEALDDEDEDEEEDRVILDKLFRVKGRAGMVMMTQVPCNYGELNSGDVFLLDTSEAIYQWNGRGSNPDERERASRFASNKALERSDVDGEPRMIIQLTQDVDDGEHRTEFWDRLPTVIRGTFGLDIELEMQEPGEEEDDNLNVIPTLHKLKSKIHQFSTGPFDALTDGKTRPFRWQLKSTELYILDTGFEYLVWIGKDAEPEFCKLEHSFKVFPLTLLYIKRNRRAAMLPIHMFKEGFEPDDFFDHLDSSEYVPTRMDRYVEVLNGMVMWLGSLAPNRQQTDAKVALGLVGPEESSWRARTRSWLRRNTGFEVPIGSGEPSMATARNLNWKGGQGVDEVSSTSRPGMEASEVNIKVVRF